MIIIPSVSAYPSTSAFYKIWSHKELYVSFALGGPYLNLIDFPTTVLMFIAEYGISNNIFY
jgi:hypothetical protein